MPNVGLDRNSNNQIGIAGLREVCFISVSCSNNICTRHHFLGMRVLQKAQSELGVRFGNLYPNNRILMYHSAQGSSMHRGSSWQILQCLTQPTHKPNAKPLYTRKPQDLSSCIDQSKSSAESTDGPLNWLPCTTERA